MGVPQGRWMVYVMEIPNLKWMRTGGTPISGTPHIYYDIYQTKHFLSGTKIHQQTNFTTMGAPSEDGTMSEPTTTVIRADSTSRSSGW